MTSDNRFEITVLNIPDIRRGVGLAVVLQTPHGALWLYDTGTGYPDGDGWAGGVNSGRDQIAPFLEARGTSHIDGTVISHAHYDHFGGLLWLADHLPPERLMDSGYTFHGYEIDDHYSRELADYATVRERLVERGTGYAPVHAGDIIDMDPDLEVEVIAPPPEFFREEHPEERPPNDPPAHYLLNANSVMLRIRHGNVVFVFGGDIEKQDQTRFLLPAVEPEKLACDVLIAPGHGLHTAPEFADAASPRVVIASCFRRWAAPDTCTARREFERRGAQVFVTGLHGNVTVTSDGRHIEVRHDPI